MTDRIKNTTQGSIWSQAAQRPRRTGARDPLAAPAEGSSSPPPGREPDPDPGAEGTSSGPASGHASEQQCLEFCPICRTADVLRSTMTPELRSQLEHLQHDALLAMRTALDHYIERMDSAAPSESTVEDIPIE